MIDHWLRHALTINIIKLPNYWFGRNGKIISLTMSEPLILPVIGFDYRKICREVAAI